MADFKKGLLPYLVVAGLILPSALVAEDALSVCQGLARSGLIDTESRRTKKQQARTEVDIFCSQTDSFESNFNRKSRGFRASFKRVADSAGIGANSGTSSGFSKSNFEKICTDKRSSFHYSYEENIDISVGSALAANVVECVKIARNETFIWGKTSINFAGTQVLFSVNRAGGIGVGTLKFDGPSKSSDLGKCTSRGSSAIGQKLVSEMAISCEINEVAGKIPRAVSGQLQFCNGIDDCKLFEFQAAAKNYEEQIISENIAELREEIRSFRGAVVGFSNSPSDDGDHPRCPTGWEFYTPAEGVFVRGYDRSGVEDPQVDGANPGTWKRVGTTWDDSLKAHGHTVRMEIGAEPHGGTSKGGRAAGSHGRTDGINYLSGQVVQENVGLETAPKHVVLMFCKKS